MARNDKSYPNSGILFKNNRKTKPTSPDYTGDAEVGGEQYRRSAWIKDGRGGARFLSLSFTAKDEQDERPARTPPARTREPGDDDMSEIPF